MGTASGHRGRYRLHPTVDEMTRRRVGEANSRGRLLRSVSPFKLRDGLSAPGALPIQDALDLVFADWDAQVAAGGISGDLVGAYKRQLRGLAGLMGTRGLTEAAHLTHNFLLLWVRMPSQNGQPSAENTWRIRRSAARSFYETAKVLGITDENPAKVIEFPGRSDRYVHALTDGQIRHMQRLARGTLTDTRTPAALALVVSGASTQESVFVTLDDVDLTNRRVWVHDGGYRSRDRWIPLFDDWCLSAVTTRLNELRAAGHDDGTWLIYKPHVSAPTRDRQAASGNRLITELMKRARVHQPGVTRAESVREWLASKVFAETCRVEDVAVRLGMASLDSVAHIVGYDWAATDEAPPAHRREHS